MARWLNIRLKRQDEGNCGEKIEMAKWKDGDTTNRDKQSWAIL